MSGIHRLPGADLELPNPYDADTREDTVSVCAWCPELNILKLQRRHSDVVIIYQMGKELRIMRNGTNLAISHGMCPDCKAKQLASVGTIRRGRDSNRHPGAESVPATPDAGGQQIGTGKPPDSNSAAPAELVNAALEDLVAAHRKVRATRQLAEASGVRYDAQQLRDCEELMDKAVTSFNRLRAVLA